MNKYVVTVLTPTFNRESLLERLYNSLKLQDSQDFQWLVVDDGSNDGTEQFFKEIHDQQFELEYIKKSNGGKHTALNYAHDYIKGELVIIVDSDDFLVQDAISTIECDWVKYSGNDRICGLSYQRCLETGKLVSSIYDSDYLVGNHISTRVNKGLDGDRCEVLRNDIFSQYIFPEYPGERFMSEGWMWTQIAYNYDTVYRNKPLYVCEYLEGGLSKSGRRLRMLSPYGMMDNCKVFFNRKINFFIRYKVTILYIVYSICAGLGFKETIEFSGQKFLTLLFFPIGFLLNKIWNRKYLSTVGKK